MTDMISNQSMSFCSSVIAGFCLGFLMNIYIGLRKELDLGAIVVAVLDTLFWLGLCVTLIWLTYVFNAGEIRLYFFLGIISGIGIYFSTIGWLMSRILHYILCLIKIAFKKVGNAKEKLVDIIYRKG
jgi:spore cortex biosynthesis protein YabQ